MPILLNRLISLTAQYGYTVALNIILAKISVNSVLFLWCAKIVGSLLSLPANRQLNRIQNKKTLLISLEIAKAGIFGVMPLLFRHWLLFGLVLLVEIISDVFDGNLTAFVPKVVERENLSRFDASITSVGSISYFVGPLLVGVLQGQPESLLFYIYGLVTFLGGLTLWLLPIVEFESNRRETGLSLLKLDFVQAIRAILSVKGLAAICLVYLLLDNMGTGLDSFEIIFVTKIIGLTAAQYAFSLSFLAVVFLIVSAALAFWRIGLRSQTVFQIGAVIYIGYAVVMLISRQFGILLVSYTLLAIGLTLMGNMVDNLIQINIDDENRSQVFILESMLTNILSAVTVFVLGILQNTGLGINLAYWGLVGLTVMVVSIIEIVNRQRT
ncbi:MFS transporter [Lentilactobacillus farraginis]|uniref:MFS transporter n=1 Tax=Lentilactobacillus farraginis DSM 18382 = JCM 14108 TaxID=1423743 RepID=X0PI54_9LACO|nr:MFS transporter [Lentilactobacillus farraginis]KRM01778.1 hypothetical protein FD41_GL001487 [Lentilactobacillus farraginis DSM 18382 = JCM 14108]GAF36186.1 hypothetical protein JCM14108_1141 [Lentilactobacillus farraginis DSM 18382 = JCM 14108]